MFYLRALPWQLINKQTTRNTARGREKSCKMPELIEQMYCSQQIVIPPKFPYILKCYCKAAIKTQPYDLLRWSYEYFNALAEHRPPPVKLRLEYPVFCTVGGLTRGCLKVMAQQLSVMEAVPLSTLKAAWQGFCLDCEELKRIFCLCEVYMRKNSVPFLHFLAVAAGFLTKTLTHTMILICETLTKEPDGGSAAIPVNQFLTMYKFLARMDASKDIKYYNGYREGQEPPSEQESSESSMLKSVESSLEESASDDFWQDDDELRKLMLINDNVARSARISVKLNRPIIGKIERSPSVERMAELELENYSKERTDRPRPDAEVDQKLREMSSSKMGQESVDRDEKKEKKKSIVIVVHDENGVEIPCVIDGEPIIKINVEEAESENKDGEVTEGHEPEAVLAPEEKAELVANYINNSFNLRVERRLELEKTFDEITAIVDKYKTASYDLGMVAGRQMSTTSGEFIVSYLEREIMGNVNEQIAILPDPDLKKKKAKPEEVAMIREVVETYFDENLDVIVPEDEEVEEEEKPMPKITVVYAVPGIGPPVDEDIIKDFEEYARDVATTQSDLFMPRNIRHFLCPPLEKCIDCLSENDVKKEEVPTGGAITD